MQSRGGRAGATGRGRRRGDRARGSDCCRAENAPVDDREPGRRRAGTLWEQARIVVQTLRTGAAKDGAHGRQRCAIPQHRPSDLSVGGVVFAAPFDLARRSAGRRGARRGRCEALTSGALQLAVSDSGALVYLPGPPEPTRDFADSRLATAPATSRPAGAAGGLLACARLARRHAVRRMGVDDGKQASVLIYALNGASAVQRLPLAGNNRFPVWSPDGRWIAFQSDRGGDLGIFRQRADGTGVAERLTTAAAWRGACARVLVSRRATPFLRRPEVRQPGQPNLPSGCSRWPTGTTAAFGGVSRPGRSGRCSRRTASGWRTRRGRRLPYRMPTAGSSCSPSRQPARCIRRRGSRGLPSGVGEIGQRELVFTAASDCGTDGGGAGDTRGWRDVRDAGAVSRERQRRPGGSEPRAWDILPDGRFIGITSTDGRHGAQFLVRDPPGPELVRGIEAAGSGAVADGDGNRHASRPLRMILARSAPAGWARSIARATRRWAAMWR